MVEFNYDKLPYERYHTRRWARRDKCRAMPDINRMASDYCLYSAYLVEGFADFYEVNVLKDGDPLDVMLSFEKALVELGNKLDDEFIHSKMQIADDEKLYEQSEYELCRRENLPKIAEQWFFGHLDPESPKKNDNVLLSYLSTIIRRTAEQN